jgi:hypothetical protein
MRDMKGRRGGQKGLTLKIEELLYESGLSG